MLVAIAGGGVGGLALAAGLIRDGHSVQVLERAAEPDAGGAAVTLFPNGLTALDRLGVVGLDTIGGAVDRMRFADPRGRPLSQLDLSAMGRATGFGVRTVPRAALVQLLRSQLPDGILRAGSEVVGVETSTAVLSDGHRVEADLVVGADGAGSAVRRSTGGSAARPTGWITWQGLSPAVPSIAAGTEGLCVVGAAGLVGLMPAGDGLLQWWFDAQGDPTFSDIRSSFAAYTDPVPALFDAVDDAGAHRFTHLVHAIPDRWAKPGATLLGDAAHVFPPSQAQGANQALEDAAVLTAALRENADVEAAVRQYESIRTGPLRRISKLAASEVTNRPPSPALRLAGRLTPPRMAARAWLANLRRCSSVL